MAGSMSTWGIYFFPFAVDIVVALILFVGRHALAAQGASETEVATIPVAFGLGYTLSGPIMRRIIHPGRARMQMIGALGLVAAICLSLASAERIGIIQALFFAVPFAVSLFFNAFQAFMLGVSQSRRRSLQITVGLYTFSWSLGFALGPFVCAMALQVMDWAQTYYLAALASVAIAGCVQMVHRASRPPVERPSDPPPAAPGRPLLVPGWMGLVIGLVGWLVIAIYWPVMAAERDVSPQSRGLVEFTWGMTLSLVALILMGWRNWQFRPGAVAGFGVLGIGGLLVFGHAQGGPGYLAGAALMGGFAATTFSFSLLHCLQDARKAAARVAVNEMMVGLSYLLGPVAAALLHRSGEDFGVAFQRAAVLLAVAVAVQVTLAVKQQASGRK